MFCVGSEPLTVGDDAELQVEGCELATGAAGVCKQRDRGCWWSRLERE